MGRVSQLQQMAQLNIIGLVGNPLLQLHLPKQTWDGVQIIIRIRSLPDYSMLDLINIFQNYQEYLGNLVFVSSQVRNKDAERKLAKV